MTRKRSATVAMFFSGVFFGGAIDLYARFEVVQVETAVLASGLGVKGVAAEMKDPVSTFTVGAVRDVVNVSGLEADLGADVTFHRPSDGLRSLYGEHPVSFHVFFRLRPSAMTRMWNMRMSQPTGRHPMQHQTP